MHKDTGSTTAVGAAMFRAAHQLLDGGSPLLRDEVILRLLKKEAIDHILQRKSDFFLPGSLAMRTHMILRSRYAEDCLYEAYTRGVRQYLLLGAGVDTFAWRRPVWAEGLEVIEADVAVSQANKRELLREAGLAVPEWCSFVSVDLETDDLSPAFAGSRLDLTKPVFVSCLGVLIYLRRETVSRIFRWLGGLPTGSEFVLTASARKWNPWFLFSAARVAAAGEPWITFFTPSELNEELRGCGFSRVHWLTPEEATERYWTRGATVLPPPKNSSIVRALI
jgi:methyltransferase (TIGR00027 family)